MDAAAWFQSWGALIGSLVALAGVGTANIYGMRASRAYGRVEQLLLQITEKNEEQDRRLTSHSDEIEEIDKTLARLASLPDSVRRLRDEVSAMEIRSSRRFDELSSRLTAGLNGWADRCRECFRMFGATDEPGGSDRDPG